MRRTLFSVVLIFALLSVACTSSPKVIYAQANDVYISAVQTLLVAQSTGEFTNDEWTNDILPLIVEGDKLLTEFDSAIKTGSPTDSIVVTLQRVLIHLQPYVARAKESSH